VVERFLEQLHADSPETVILRGRCYEQENVPFNAFDGIIDALSHHLKQLEEVQAAALLPANIQLLAGMFPVLRRVPAVSRMAPSRRVIGSPEQLRRQAFEVLRQLFESLAGSVPLVLFADDLQWADRDSLLLLEALLAGPDPPQLLLIATMRSSPSRGVAPPAQVDLPKSLRARFRELPVGRLSPTDSAALVARLREEGAVGATQSAALLVREAGGHPLFLQELVRYASTRQSIDPHVRLEEVLLERISGLDENARRLMEILAITGMPLSVEALAWTAELPQAECVRWLRTLQTAQLVRVDGFGADRTVQTFHDRVREAVVNGIHSQANTRPTRGRPPSGSSGCTCASGVTCCRWPVPTSTPRCSPSCITSIAARR
jgi:hypothetical protein